MPSDATSTRPAYDPGPLKADWRDEAWRAVIGSADAWLRSYYRIEEFTADPNCVLRIGLMRATMPVWLSDGTEIREGEMIGALHLWNEHVPRYTETGPNLIWAKEMRRRVLHSLSVLADYLERGPAWQAVQAFCGDSMLSSRIGGAQMRRLAPRYGFEMIEPPASLSRTLHTLADSFIVWGLTRAFNPAALPRQRFLHDHHKLWISRATLCRLYGREPMRTEAEPHAAMPERAL
jgi:YkoP-like protein